MVPLRFGGAHPDLLWLLPITAALLDGPETGAIVGFWAGLAFDLVLPTPFGLSALVGCLLGFAVGSLTAAVDPRATWLKPVAAVAGSVAADMLFAVLGAIMGQQQMVQIDFLALGPRGRRVEPGPGAPGQPADALGSGRRDPTAARSSRPRPTADSGEAHPPTPVPGRPAPPQAVHPGPTAVLVAERCPPAAHAAAQGRQRRLHRRLARGGGVAPEPAPAHRGRHRARPLRPPRPASVDAPGGRREEPTPPT